MSRPRDLGVALNRWSLRELRRYLIRRRIVTDISVKHLRRILRTAGITHQRTRTWKQSPDPYYEAKKRRIRRLCRRAETRRLTDDEVVVCFR